MILPLLVLAQAGFTYTDNKGEFSLRASAGMFSQVQNGFQFDLSKGVNLNSRAKKITLSATEVRALVVRSKGAKQPDSLQSAKATGNVRVTQNTAGTIANLQSNSANYTAQGDGAIVQATGSVRIQNVDPAKRQTLVATGVSGSASISPSAKRGISKALLNGPVRVEILQAGKQRSKMVFTGNKLTMEGNVVKLLGNVKATGTGESQFGTLSNVDVLTIYVNDKGEFTRFSFSSSQSSSLHATLQPIPQGSQTVYEDPTRSLRAYNATESEGESLDNGSFQFRMLGNPAIVESKLQGLNIKAPSLFGIFAPPPPGQRAGFIENLEVKGGGIVVFDSAVRFQTAVEHAAKYGTPAPAPRIGREMATLRSGRFTYAGNATAGTFTIPEAFTVDLDSTGRRMVNGKPTVPGQTPPKIPKDYRVVSQFVGASGSVGLNPAAREMEILKAGSILGPVTLTVNMTETSALSPEPEISNMKVNADRIDFDFERANTITLTGNVRVEGIGNTYRGTSEGDSAVLTVDPKTLQVLKIRITGRPTKGTLQERKPGGNK